MKFAVGSLIFECNTFSLHKTDLKYFENHGYLLFGDEIIERHKGVRNELAGFINAGKKNNIEIFPTCAAWALPHGIVEFSTYERLKDQFLSRIKNFEHTEGVYLALHGSMVAEGIDDVEGDLIRNVRRLIGKKPLIISLDFHANVTEKMVKNADILIGYNSFPHTNMYEVGQKAAALACECYDKIEDLKRVFIKIPMIAPLERMTTVNGEPMARIINEIKNLEEEEGILCVSFFGVHCWLDIENMGSSIVAIVSKERCGYAQREISRIATSFWNNRELFFDVKLYSPQKAIKEALKTKDRPVVLNESSDNVGAGATGDSTHVLRALLDMSVKEPTILTIVDPEAVEEATEVGVGHCIELSIGGKIDRRFSEPIKVRGKVRTIFDGRYKYTGPVYHGVETSMGKTVVLEINNNIFVELTELPVFTIDPEHYRCVGLFPERMKLVVIKSQGSFKASYDKISDKVFYLDTPGISSANITRLPFGKVKKNELYPFNRSLIFVPKPLIL